MNSFSTDHVYPAVCFTAHLVMLYMKEIEVVTVDSMGFFVVVFSSQSHVSIVVVNPYLIF